MQMILLCLIEEKVILKDVMTDAKLLFDYNDKPKKYIIKSSQNTQIKILISFVTVSVQHLPKH